MDSSSSPPKLTGRYSVAIESANGMTFEKVCFLASTTYNYSSGVGVYRLPSQGEAVVIGRTVNNQFFIIGSYAPGVTGQNRSTVPQVGIPPRDISENELLILGNRTELPTKMTYMLFDRSGGVEIKAGDYPYIRLSKASGFLTTSANRSRHWTRSGYEAWGHASGVTVGLKEPQRAPALWRRVVRTREADNNSLVIESYEGDVEGDRDINVKEDSIISAKNAGNRYIELLYKSGKRIMASGNFGIPQTGAIRPKPKELEGFALLSPIRFELNPTQKITKIRSPVIILDGGSSENDHTGQVVVTGRDFSVSMIGPVSIASNSNIQIRAPRIALDGNIVMTGNVMMNGPVLVNGTIAASGPVLGNPCTWTPT